MTIEEAAMRWAGLDPPTINRIADNAEHLLGVVESKLDSVNTLIAEITALAATIQAELPRAKQLVRDVRSQIAAYEANQQRFRGRGV